VIKNAKTLLPALLLIGTLAGTATADARDLWGGGGRSQVVLVTPQGDILDYVPEEGEVTTRFDTYGRRVLIDRYGVLIATEVPADQYYSWLEEQGRRNSRVTVRETPSDGYGQQEIITGTVPNRGTVDREPLAPTYPDAPAPDDQADQANEDVPQYANTLPKPYTPPKSVEPALQRDDPNLTLSKRSKPEVVALQVFLDREGFSPGVIDGRMGSNVQKAVAAYEQTTGEKLNINDLNDDETVMQNLRLSGGLPIVNYTITAADAAGPYVAEIPSDYSQKAKLPAMSYTSTSEMLAERFHMDEDYLKELNPGVDFSIPGTIIKVVNPGNPKKGNVTRILADKAKKQVLAYGEDGGLIAAYPATIGSSDTPSPSGTVTVERVALNPGYTYNPKINFKQGENNQILQINPGPNGPVGNVWIALSKPTYGIHGTPEPSQIGKTASHGCVRLTNWDANELAKMVKPGVTVEFVD
jgi:lipoprotein-anchoring transpeptidase ErfK/SrfK